MDALVASVKLVPYNWSAWLKLAACLDGAEEVSTCDLSPIQAHPSLQLEATMQFIPPVFPSLFFYVHATLEIHAAGESLHETLDELGEMFPRSSTVTGLRALVHYHVRGTFHSHLEHILMTSQNSRKRRGTSSRCKSRIRIAWRISTSSPTSST